LIQWNIRYAWAMYCRFDQRIQKIFADSVAWADCGRCAAVGYDSGNYRSRQRKRQAAGTGNAVCTQKAPTVALPSGGVSGWVTGILTALHHGVSQSSSRNPGIFWKSAVLCVTSDRSYTSAA
jgi:hypothetical protein